MVIHRFRRPALLLAGLALAALCHAGGNPASSAGGAGDVVHLPIGGRTFAFVISDSAAPRSAAARADLLSDNGLAAFEEPHFVLSRLVVRSRDAAALAAAADELGLVLEPFPVAADYYRLKAGSVADVIVAIDPLRAVLGVESVEAVIERPKAWRGIPNDPQLVNQWHLKNLADPGFDANVFGAWEQGFTGQGVLIGIADSGVQHVHLDLASNYDAAASQTFETGPQNVHGTSVAGVAAAVGNNNRQVAGVAYAARFSEMRVGTDEQDAEAIAHRNDLHDVKNHSWGPPDNGNAHVLPNFVMDALETGVLTGRGGLGTVMVWAGGNGALPGDRVDYDPLASSRYSIAVGAIGDKDTFANYSEPGASLLVVAQSTGNQRGILTTALNNATTSTFGGTSASAPIVSGVVALMLQANPNLTWRDVQHVLVDTARQCHPTQVDWEQNAAGRNIHYRYGYGAVDATAAVNAAMAWVNVPRDVRIDTGVIEVNQTLPDNMRAGIPIDFEIERDIRIEAVELFVNATTPAVGQLVVSFVSPGGTRSIVADARNDFSQNYVNYKFTSMRHIGERSAGAWRVRIGDAVPGGTAIWHDFRMVIHGTPSCPGDVNENGVYDLGDLLISLVQFDACDDSDAYLPELDVDNSGCNDFEDVLHILRNFGQTCE